ncbi:MAG: ABC transporter permease [Clostridia bacterium]|nr:ABC transporter permease [Clostridia bacterium]
MGAIYRREMRAYFTTPIGYVFMIVFLMLASSIFCLTTIQLGERSNLFMYFTILIFLLIIIIPILTMKSFSEEKKMRTEQLLLTSPISIAGMVAGKYFAAMTMYTGTLLVSALNFYTIFKFAAEGSDPNVASIVGNHIALILVGSVFIAIGIFISSLTENQLAAAIITVAVILVLLVSGFLADLIPFYPIRMVVKWISIFTRFSYFTYGIFDYSAVLYYLSISFLFLFLTGRVFDKRRWG